MYEMIKNGFKYEEKRSRQPLLDSDDERAIVVAAEDDRDLKAAEIARDKKILTKNVSATHNLESRE